MGKIKKRETNELNSADRLTWTTPTYNQDLQLLVHQKINQIAQPLVVKKPTQIRLRLAAAQLEVVLTTIALMSNALDFSIFKKKIYPVWQEFQAQRKTHDYLTPDMLRPVVGVLDYYSRLEVSTKGQPQVDIFLPALIKQPKEGR